MCIYIDPQTPGANAYKLEEMINGRGTVYNSRFVSPNAKTISMKFRSSFDTDSITPGPGAYQTFSEFGIYRAKNADEFERKTANTFYKDKSRTTKSDLKKSKTLNEDTANKE